MVGSGLAVLRWMGSAFVKTPDGHELEVGNLAGKGYRGS